MYTSDFKHPLPSLEEKLHKLYTLNRDKKIDLRFRPPYFELLQACGNPHLALPPVIHVAGTNGKGSTIAFMRAILEQAGYKVHTYTSPHLCHFNERITLAGKQITDDMLESLIDETLALNDGNSLTFFEITTALAFTAFSRTPADILLLEVGLGGRLDCTNVIESPLATIITSVAYDHMEHLGETLHEIAAEKAGIMKKNTPCIIGAQNKAAIDAGIINLFESKALELNAPLFCRDTDWFITQHEDQICFTFNGEELRLPLPALNGPHQINNAGAALAALQAIRPRLPRPIDSSAMELGLCKTKWSARLQKLPVELFNLPQNWEIFLDGGHNESAAEMLAGQAALWRAQDQKPLHLVIGMMNHKDPKSFVKPLLPYAASITAVGVPGEPAALKPQTLAALMQQACPSLSMAAAATAQDALNALRSNMAGAGRVLITGSLYLAGHVLKDAQITP